MIIMVKSLSASRIISMIVVGVFGVSLISQSVASEKQDLTLPCDASSLATGKIYNVLGSGINVRKGPSTSYKKIINQQASNILGTTEYIKIDDTVTVYEDCTKNGWSRIKVVTPDWLAETHIGWVASKFLDNGKNIKGNKYAKKISSYALSPYTKQAYPKTVKKYGSRLKEVERFRRKAAEMAIDSGKCDFVEMSDISDKSSIQHLIFWVDCRNKQRFYYDEFQLK
ncbi:hypothetical protein EF707_08325 [Vibrio fluvialis]|nr:hypothetical protein [Vibrio fluvialis]